MARGRQSDQWNHTADLICNLHRVFLGGKWQASQFHPFTMEEAPKASGKTGFDARIYAVAICGQAAIEKFQGSLHAPREVSSKAS